MRYTVTRKVKSLNWFVKNCELTVDGYKFKDGVISLTNEMIKFCDKVITISKIAKKEWALKIPDDMCTYINDDENRWVEWMFEPGVLSISEKNEI